MNDLPVSRNLLIGLGVVVAVALLWFLVLAPLFAPAEEEFTVPPPPVTETPAPPSIAEEPPVDETFEVFLARSPFDQLVEAPGSTPPIDGAFDPVTGEPIPDPGEDTDGDGRPDGQPDGAQVGVTSVHLVEVFTDDDGTPRVIVEVNGTLHTVGEGEVFADRFRVLDISGQCATLLFGDSRFVLCAGEQIRK